MTKFLELLCTNSCAGGRTPLQYRLYHAERRMRYPLIDHDTVYKVVGSDRSKNAYFLVSHPYWDESSEEQLQDLLKISSENNIKVVTRDGLWGARKHAIKQVFIFGANVDADRVLSLPYDFFDDRCSAPE